MEKSRTVGAALLAVIVLLLGVAVSAAQTPVDPTSSGIPYVDYQVHTLAANSSQWYRFDYALDNLNHTRPIVTIKLVGGYGSGIQYEIWTAEGFANPAASKPAGRGSPVNLDCETGEIKGNGQCISPDLNWAGAFGTPGAYYVNVVNTNNVPSQFQLWIQGSLIALGSTTPAPPGTYVPSPSGPAAVATPPASGTVPPPATAIVTATRNAVTSGTMHLTVVAPGGAMSSADRAPAAAPAPQATAIAATANADDPNRAGMIDGQPHTLGANGVTWYRFDYANNHMTGQRPLVVLKLVNGINSGVDAQVYAPENIAAWWEKRPVGRTTVQLIDCETGEPSESGECVSNDLLWKGNFGADGTYWVRVVNTNNVPIEYTLTYNVIQPIAP